MSVAALPPPSLAPRPVMPTQQKRPIMMPRPSAGSSSSSTPASAARPPAGIKARPAAAAAPPPIVRRGSSASSTTPRSGNVPLAQPIASGSNNKDTSSSSGKVFAKPSKEWVLPERAKPGRKVSVEEPDNKRQSQNRLSQRAHRARRTDYIQTLEERLRQYEADEIHSNVRLQEVARALKADNERLKKEVVTLRMDLSELTSLRNGWDAERAGYEDLVGRLRSELAGLRGADVEPFSPRSRLVRPQEDSDRSASPVDMPMPTLVPDGNAVRRPTMDCPICPDPDPDCPCQQRDNIATASTTHHTPAAPLAALHLAVKAMAEHDPSPTPGGIAHASDCGVCTNHAECLCRAIDDMHEQELEQDIKPVIFPSPSPGPSDLLGGVDFGGPVDGGDGCGLCTSASFCACRATAASSTGSSQSPIVGFAPLSGSAAIPTTTTTMATGVYAAVPTSTAAVPLKLRRGIDRPKAKSVWALESAMTSPPSTRLDEKAVKDAMCSGDPSNCEACRDDSFGKEFCSNLFEKAETAPTFKPCADCPGNCMSIKSLLCPSDPSQGTATASEPTTTTHTAAPRAETESSPDHDETMTCDQAWKALKAHPNSRFASLSLLADVVAGRTVCTGPKDPLPGSPLTLPVSGPPVPPTAITPSSATPGLGTGVGVGVGVGVGAARYKPAVEASSATPSPILSATGGPAGLAVRKRNMAVETSAVRDALRLLDRTTPGPGSGTGSGMGMGMGSPGRGVDDSLGGAGASDGPEAKRRKVG